MAHPDGILGVLQTMVGILKSDDATPKVIRLTDDGFVIVAAEDETDLSDLNVTLGNIDGRLVDLLALHELATTAGVSTGPTVGNTTTAILPANTDRGYASFVNDSDEDIYLGLGVAAVMNRGKRLNANGGSFEINLTDLFKGAVNAICSSGGKIITVDEIERA